MANIDLRGRASNAAGTAKASLTVELWEAANYELNEDTAGAAARTAADTTDANGEWNFDSQDATKTWLIKIIDTGKAFLHDGRNKIQLTDLDLISDLFVDTISEHTSANGVVIDGVTLKDGGITATAATDFGTANITTGGMFVLDVDGTAENAAGSLTMGAGNDAGIFFDGTNMVLITNGAGASGIILDSEDDTVEIKGSGTLQATFDTGGINLVAGDAYEINDTSVLNATTLGGAVVTSSLTTVGALDSGSITSGFGAIDNGTSNITTGGIIKLDVDGTAENAAGSLTMGAGNDAGLFFDGTNLVIITNGAGASGIILDSEDDTVEIKGSGTLQATFDTGGLNLVSGDAYEINDTSVLNATTLGGAVVASSLTSVGTLTSLTVNGVFSNDDTTESTSTTTGSIHTDGGLGVVGDIYAGDDIFLTSGAVLNFDAGDVLLTHASNLLTLSGGNFTQAGASGSTLTLKTTETTMANNANLGQIDFAGDDTNTGANKIGAQIIVQAESTWTGSSNFATDMHFYVNRNGSSSVTEALVLAGSSTVVNAGKVNMDVIVHTSNWAPSGGAALYIDSGRDNVGIGNAASIGTLFGITPGEKKRAFVTSVGTAFDIQPDIITDDESSGTLAILPLVHIGIPTYIADGARTYTAAPTVYIAGAPVASTNATITSGYAMWVDADEVRIDGDIGDTTNRVTKAWTVDQDTTNAENVSSWSRIKKNITDYTASALDVVRQISVVEFEHELAFDPSDRRKVGVLAESIADPLVAPMGEYANGYGYGPRVDMLGLAALNTRAIQELEDVIGTLRNQLENAGVLPAA
jgi:hypothetical protein